MKNNGWAVALHSLTIAVTGLLFAFAIFIISLKTDQIYMQKLDEAISGHADVTATRPLAILSVAIETVAGIPFVISVLIADLIQKKKNASRKSRRFITVTGSFLFILLMTFLFKALAHLDQMYELIPPREMAYDIMIMLIQFFTCIPAGIILLISLIALLISSKKKD